MEGTVWDFSNAKNVTPVFKLVGIKRKPVVGLPIGAHMPGTLKADIYLEGDVHEPFQQPDEELSEEISVDFL